MSEPDMTTPYFARIPHTADLAIRVWGGDVRELFVNAARALFSLMSEPPPAVTLSREITVSSTDQEALLVDWLNELLYRHEVDGETYTAFEIDVLQDEQLHARVSGAPTVLRTKGIKAVTFNDLSIRQVNTHLEATIIFDV
ncbi:MAG TPA: archease [Armatimonadota bacterium]|jgi:SHS2 domain-containing protein